MCDCRSSGICGLQVVVSLKVILKLCMCACACMRVCVHACVYVRAYVCENFDICEVFLEMFHQIH